MAFDAYSTCPGGTGKKTKFCCSDFVHELEKIDRMIEGEQFIACMQHIDRLEAAGQHRACLMAVKSELLRATNQIEAAVAFAKSFLERFPQNPIAWSESALLTAATESGRTAIPMLQKAIALSGGNVERRVYESIEVVANLLINEGDFAAGRALLHLLTALDPEDNQPMEKLVFLNRSAEIPLLLKTDPAMIPCPADAPWKVRYEKAVAPLRQAQWQEAADRLASLAADFPDSPAVWNNLSLIRSWLADDEGTREAMMKYAALPVPLEDAVETAARAMMTSEDPLGDAVNMVRWSWDVRDAERLHESLLSDHRIVQIPVDASLWTSNNAPPPRLGGLVLDRSSLQSGDGLSLANIPCVLGQALLFGRQTDRAARLEIVGLSSADAQQVKATLREIGGDALDPEPQETIVGKTPASHQLISRRWLPPRGTLNTQLEPLLAQDQRDALLHRWPDLPLGVLDGRSLRQAAADPAAHVKALAAILVMEQWTSRSAAHFDFNILRTQLGLPAFGPLNVPPGEIGAVPLVRLHRVEMEKLSDEDLMLAFQRASLYHAWDAVRKAAKAIIDRPSFNARRERMEAFRMLAQSATTLEEGIAHIDQGRRTAMESGHSCAAWDLLELSFRFGHNDLNEAMRLMQHIETRHIKEPGVAQTLTQMLVDVGLLNPDGTPAMPAGRPTPAEVAAPPADPAKLWTPGGESSGASGGKLWTPGA